MGADIALLGPQSDKWEIKLDLSLRSPVIFGTAPILIRARATNMGHVQIYPLHVRAENNGSSFRPNQVKLLRIFL